MQQDLGTVVLHSGERVAAAVISAPGSEWADRLTGLLGFGEPSNWGIFEVLTKSPRVQAYFYVLHRNGVPFSNMMTCEVNGVGLFGHVFTSP